jgi:hypothetical protein
VNCCTNISYTATNRLYLLQFLTARFIGTTAVALNEASANKALTGILSIVFLDLVP